MPAIRNRYNSFSTVAKARGSIYRAISAAFIASRFKQHQVEPALQLLASKDEDGLREAGNMPPDTHAKGIDEAQEVIGEHRLLAEYGLDLAGICVRRDELHQLERERA